MNYNFKTAKLFTWEGVPKTFEELKEIKRTHALCPSERRFLTEIIAKFDDILGTGTNHTTIGADKIMENPTFQKTKKPKVVMFRDWILGDRIYPDHDQIVSISGNDFTILASHYRKFQTLVPYFQRQEVEAKAKIADEQEKLQEEHRYNQANGLDSVAFGHLSLSYPQWKQKGRYVKPGEKSKMQTMDGTGESYALFHFTQTDVAENRYKTIKPRCENNQPCTCLGVCEDKR